MRQPSGLEWGNRDFFPRHVGTKTAVSGISYEKIVQEKDPGNRENGALVPRVWREDKIHDMGTDGE